MLIAGKWRMQRNKIVKFPISHGIHQVICVKLAKRGPLLVVLVSRVFQCHLVVIPKVTVYHHTPWLLPVAGNDFLNRHGISPLFFSRDRCDSLHLLVWLPHPWQVQVTQLVRSRFPNPKMQWLKTTTLARQWMEAFNHPRCSISPQADAISIQTIVFFFNEVFLFAKSISYGCDSKWFTAKSASFAYIYAHNFSEHIGYI